MAREKIELFRRVKYRILHFRRGGECKVLSLDVSKVPGQPAKMA